MVLLEGKYFTNNRLASLSQVLIESTGCESNHMKASLVNEKGNSRRHMVPLDTPLYLKVSHMVKKHLRSWFGSSFIDPHN